jgi:hypothetical protein
MLLHKVTYLPLREFFVPSDLVGFPELIMIPEIIALCELIVPPKQIVLRDLFMFFEATYTISTNGVI